MCPVHFIYSSTNRCSPNQVRWIFVEHPTTKQIKAQPFKETNFLKYNLDFLSWKGFAQGSLFCEQWRRSLAGDRSGVPRTQQQRLHVSSSKDAQLCVSKDLLLSVVSLSFVPVSALRANLLLTEVFLRSTVKRWLPVNAA